MRCAVNDYEQTSPGSPGSSVEHLGTLCAQEGPVQSSTSASRSPIREHGQLASRRLALPRDEWLQSVLLSDRSRTYYRHTAGTKLGTVQLFAEHSANLITELQPLNQPDHSESHAAGEGLETLPISDCFLMSLCRSSSSSTSSLCPPSQCCGELLWVESF